jgi:AcrR family transcriptional regulator
MTFDELSPRERRHQRTQQAILTAARAILAEGGVESLSIRAIADRIDYSPAGLYEYYGSKEEIIGALCWEGHRLLKRYMEQIPLTLPPDEYIIELGIAYIHFATQNPDYFLLIFTTPLTRPSYDNGVRAVPSVEMMSEDSSFPVLVRGVARAQAEGVINFLPEHGAFETSYAFWTIVHGAAMLRVCHLSALKVDFEKADRQIIATFIRGLRTVG